ncbi:hypothetical protein [Desulfobacula sp.]
MQTVAVQTFATTIPAAALATIALCSKLAPMTRAVTFIIHQY